MSEPRCDECDSPNNVMTAISDNIWICVECGDRIEREIERMRDGYQSPPSTIEKPSSGGKAE